MTIKIFISYSHRDGQYKDSLETHLSLLKRNGVISTWSDREIKPGQEWGEEIDENLESADIILFLISSDFIASDYCFDIEAKRAIEKHAKNEAVLIPIIIRPCDWKNSPIGKIQALPKDAQPITTWNNIDEAWLNVTDGIKSGISLTEKNHKSEIIKTTKPKQQINPIFLKWLNESEVELSHRNLDKVNLTDIFVFQDLRCLDHEVDEASLTINAASEKLKDGWIMIFGEEQLGKTSLAKNIFIKLHKENRSPILINGADIKTADLEKITAKAIKNQYTEDGKDEITLCDHGVIIIDDFSSTTLNKKHQNLLIERIKDKFKTIILLASDSFQYVAPDISALDGFSHYELLPFGNSKRYELIKRWVELGVEEEITEEQLYTRIDALKQHIDAIVKKNIVPSKPIYLLTIIQTFEAYKPLGIELSSYGHCYQYLIYKALEKSKIQSQEIESYINYLTELAGYIFTTKSQSVQTNQIKTFFKAYNEKFISLNSDEVLEKLTESRIINLNNNEISFKYRYIFYFYAAKYLSESLVNNKGSKAEIHSLIENLHKEESANIIIFITHHTKDPWILDEIQLSMMELFDGHKEAKLESSDLEFMKDFLNEIPKIVLEQREIEKERDKANLEQDKAELIENDIDKRADSLAPNDLLAKVNRTFKAIEISGQILRNRRGSLDKKTLVNLLEQAYGVGLRFLQYFMDLSGSYRDEIIENIKHMITENPNVNNNQLEKEARNLFLLITYGVIFGILRKIALSVGAKELEAIYLEVGNSMNSPAVRLINQYIELQFMKRIDTVKIDGLYRDFENNPACSRVLREIVVQHIYMHQVNYKDKQRISEILNIPVENQLQLENKVSG